MTRYIAKEGDRLDTIIYNRYGTVDAKITEAVMEVNKSLLNTPKLSAGDVVYLPDITTTQSESDAKALW